YSATTTRRPTVCSRSCERRPTTWRLSQRSQDFRRHFSKIPPRCFSLGTSTRERSAVISKSFKTSNGILSILSIRSGAGRQYLKPNSPSRSETNLDPVRVANGSSCTLTAAGLRGRVHVFATERRRTNCRGWKLERCASGERPNRAVRRGQRKNSQGGCRGPSTDGFSS